MINEINQYVGKKGIIKVGQLSFIVEIKDVKVSYGNTRYLVAPVEGSGEAWVEKINLIK